jgi:hypothetical protein
VIDVAECLTLTNDKDSPSFKARARAVAPGLKALAKKLRVYAKVLEKNQVKKNNSKNG